MTKKIRVAHAEDQTILLESLSYMLNQEPDIEVVILARDGKQLLDALKVTETDIVMLDLDMPGIDGKRTFSLLQQFYPQIKIIMFSMHTSYEFVSKYMRNGALAYLQKEIEVKAVVNAIRDVYKKGFHYNNLVTRQFMTKLGKRKVKRVQVIQGERLTPREMEVLQLICKGRTNGEISGLLYISQRTVENHRVRIYKKTGSLTVVDAVVFAIAHGIYKLDI